MKTISTMALALLLAVGCSPDTVRDGGGGDGDGGGGGEDSSGGSGGSGKSGGSGGKSGGSGGSGKSGGAGGSSKSGGSGGSQSGGSGGSESGGSGGSMMAGSGGTAMMGGSGGTAMMGGMGGTAPVFAPIKYTFEESAQGWSYALENRDMGFVEPVQSTEKALSGTGSLKVEVMTTMMAEKRFVGIQGGVSETGFVRPIKKITWNLWLPLDHKLKFVQAYVLGFGEGAPGWKSVTSARFPLNPGDWTKFELEFAEAYPVSQFGGSIGLELTTNDAWTGTVYIDDVEVVFE